MESQNAEHLWSNNNQWVLSVKSSSQIRSNSNGFFLKKTTGMVLLVILREFLVL